MTLWASSKEFSVKGVRQRGYNTASLKNVSLEGLYGLYSYISALKVTTPRVPWENEQLRIGVHL